MPLKLGRHDPFGNIHKWDEATSSFWIAALQRRATAPEQVRLRRRVREIATLGAGDVVVEVGCGIGALVEEVASDVAPNGLVIGLEPQKDLATCAVERLKAAAYLRWGIIQSSGANIPLADGVARAAIEHTVLIHLSDEDCQKVCNEMARVTATRGRVICVDHDADTWAIDHPDREVTRRLVQFNSDQRFADGWRGRHLRRLLLGASLRNIHVEPWVHVDTHQGSYLFELCGRIANAAVDAGYINDAESHSWMDTLQARANSGQFFSSINFNIAVGEKM